jgi:hypothetical protein
MPVESPSKSKEVPIFFESPKFTLSLVAIVYGYFLLAVYLRYMGLWSFQLQFFEKPNLILPLGLVGLAAIILLGFVFATPAVPHSMHSRGNDNKVLSYLLAPNMIFIPSLLWLVYLFITYYLLDSFSSWITEILCAAFLTAAFTLLQLIIAFSKGIKKEITPIEYESYSDKAKKRAFAWLFIRNYFSNLLIGLYSFLFPVLLTKSSQLGTTHVVPVSEV